MSNNESDNVLSDGSETDMDVDFVDISVDSNMEDPNSDYSSTSSEIDLDSSLSSPVLANSISSGSDGSHEDISISPSTSESSNEIATPHESIPEAVESHQTAETGDNQQPTGSRDIQHLTESRKQKSVESEEQSTTKKTKIDGEENSFQEDAFSCPICLESLTNTGSHKPACLKCGHIFGEGCLQRWIKVGCNKDARRCPTCNTKASLKDIRILYAKKLVAVDNAELTALEKKLEQENHEKNAVKLDLEKWKYKVKQLNNEVERLKTMVEKVRSDQATTSQSTSIRYRLKKMVLGKNPGCRVMAYNKNNMLLVVSQHSESPLFSSSHVIRKLNATLLEPTKECIYAHKKQIRDLTFHPLEHNLLASVSLDKCISLTDLVSNTVVSSVEVEEPLWSCCWSGNNSNLLIAGGQMGSIYFVDRRFMKVLNSETQRKPACVSLIPLPPSSTRMFINGGFVKTRMDYLSVFEQVLGQEGSIYRETGLPLRGLWSSSSYDSESNLLLSTSKPCGFNSRVRHVVSKISNFNESGPQVIPVVSFEGGDKATQLSRSCFVSPSGLNEDLLVSSFDEKSNAIKLFSINSRKNVHNFPVTENYLDLCPLTDMITNGRRTLAALSDNSLSVFTV